MIRISHIRLHNVCQFADMDADIGIGLNAVCGRNGSGKTSLLRGLVYGLTGMVDGDYGTQTDLQKDGTADPGFVELTLQAADASYVLRRYTAVSAKGFRDSLTKTAVDGRTEVVAEKRQPVSAYMNFLLQVEDSLLFRICWGRQSRLDTLLTATSNEVSDFLTDLYDMRICETLRQRIKAQLGTVADISRACIERRDKAVAQMARIPDIDSLEAALKQAEGLESGATSELQAMEAHMRSAIDPAVKEANLRQAETSLAGFKELMDNDPGPEPPHPEESAQALRMEDIQLRKRQSGYDTLLYAKRNELSSVESEITRNRTERQEILQSRDSILAKLAEPDERCRLCGGIIEDHEGYERDRCKLYTGFDSIQAYSENVDARVALKDARIELRQKAVEDLKSGMAVAEAERKECADRLKALEVQLPQRLAYDQWVNACAVKRQAERDYGELYEKVELLRAQPVSEQGAAVKLERLRKAHADAVAATNSARMALADGKARKAYLEQALVTCTQEVAQYEINRTARETLTSLRDVLSAKRVQSRYLKARIEDLNARIAKYMEGTGMPFSLYLDTVDHTFKYLSADGFVHPAAHLSGAQRNISSTVVQMAVFESVGPELNLFLVDEPSEALDNENKLMLADLFRRMAGMLPAIQGTMLIVTRDDLLIDCCEQVINVTKE